MSFKIFFGSQLLAVLNMGYLSYIHYQLKFGLGAKSLCNINDILNCDVVNVSPYAVLFGIPVSLLGFFANLLLLVIGFLGEMENSETKKQHLKNISFVGAILLVLTSFVMAGISFLFLHTYCLFCLLAYLLSFISLGAVARWSQFTQKTSLGHGLIASTSDFLFHNKAGFKFLLSGLLLIPFSWLCHDIIKKNMAGRQLRQIGTLILDWKATPVHEFQTDTALISSPHRPVKMTILEFADFQCPHCKMASEILHTFVKSRDDVQLIFMSFPLDGSCNPAIERASNGRSCWLASATYCATQQDKGWQMHDHIFEMFNEVQRSQLPEIAEGLGLNVDNFSECLDADSTLEAIRSQARQGEQANITGTPTLFVNGRILPSRIHWMILEAIYNEL